MMMSLTSELTMVPKAAPMITPKARSMTLPRIAKSLNSLSMVPPPSDRSPVEAMSGNQAAQGVHDPVHVLILHAGIERDREHALVIGVGAGQALEPVAAAVIGLPVD